MVVGAGYGLTLPLIFGTNNSQIVTLVARQRRYVMMAKADSKDTETVINALVERAQREYYVSLAWDRGKEMADHQRFTFATDIKLYFCDPQKPWKRGSNENTSPVIPWPGVGILPTRGASANMPDPRSER